MAIYTNLPIYKTFYSLLLSVSKAMPNLSRDCRFTIGQDLRKSIIDIIILIYKANAECEKTPYITLMKDYLIKTKINIRIMGDLHYITLGKQSEWMELVVSMSKQMSAWEKYHLQKK